MDRRNGNKTHVRKLKGFFLAGKAQNVAILVVWRGFVTKADMKKTGIISMGLSRISISIHEGNCKYSCFSAGSNPLSEFQIKIRAKLVDIFLKKTRKTLDILLYVVYNRYNKSDKHN